MWDEFPIRMRETYRLDELFKNEFRVMSSPP